MWIEFTTVVVWSQVDPRLVNETHDLNVIGRLENLYTVEGTVWNEACTVAGFRAPGDFLSLGRTNGRVWFRRRPQAEVVNMVDERRLAHGLLVLRRGIANVVAYLRAAKRGGIVIYLVWDSIWVVVVFVDKWGWVLRVGLCKYGDGSSDDEKSGTEDSGDCHTWPFLENIEVDGEDSLETVLTGAHGDFNGDLISVTGPDPIPSSGPYLVSSGPKLTCSRAHSR